MISKARYSDWNKRSPAVKDPAILLAEFNAIAEALCMNKYEYWTMLGVRYVPGKKFWPPPRNWKNNRDKLDRMALFIRIYDLAGELIPVKHGAEYWLRCRIPGKQFGGHSPLELLVLNKYFEGLFFLVQRLEGLLKIT